MSLLSFAIWLGVAAVCGAIGRAIAGGARGGCLVSTAVGFVGAYLGTWLAGQAHVREPFVVRAGGHAFPVLSSIVGAALFVAVVHLISGRRGD